MNISTFTPGIIQSDQLFKLHPLIDQLAEKFKELFNPSQNIFHAIYLRGQLF